MNRLSLRGVKGGYLPEQVLEAGDDVYLDSFSKSAKTLFLLHQRWRPFPQKNARECWSSLSQLSESRQEARKTWTSICSSNRLCGSVDDRNSKQGTRKRLHKNFA